MKSLKLKNIGPITEANIKFGDLTVFVGGQAMGKSVAMEMVKIIEDAGYIHQRMEAFGLDCSKPEKLFSNYFGAGKDKIWTEGKSEITMDAKNITRQDMFAKNRAKDMKTFYIPAQRVVVIDKGWPTPFQGFDSMYPFVTREFSEIIRTYMDTSFSNEEGKIFPQDRRMQKELREGIEKTIFRNQTILLKANEQNRKMVMLKTGDNIELPITTWSTGQREFIPLLVGIYYCLPRPGPKAYRKDKITRIIIEEIEMGLHPGAIIRVMLLVMELLNQDYKVILSTHSPTVLDLVWALVEIQTNKADGKYFRKLFNLTGTNYTNNLAREIAKKAITVNYFKETNGGVSTVDISGLDPGSDSSDEWGWGGLSEFSGNIADIVGELHNDVDNA
ncbi:MAG: ATP-binding protein [Candidatus Aminicenantes bacterium]|nr:ATP-binding protein [Candidatus Aminicenantes bacterium]